MFTIDIPTSTGSVPAHTVLPDPRKHGPGPFPGVVVIHDVTGSGADLHNQLRRVADYGYIAVGPNLFADGARPLCVAKAMRDLVRRHGPALDTVLATRAWLRDRPDCSGAIGVIGFCLGGGFALLAATQGFDAAAPFYGQIPFGQHAALEGSCPVVASFGKRDPTLPRAEARLRRALEDHRVEHDIKTYDGAGHSFANAIDLGAATPLLRVTGFAYHEQASDDAWRRVNDFFDRHLRDNIDRAAFGGSVD